MYPRPYIYVAAQGMWGWIYTCTRINSENILPKELKRVFLTPFIKKIVLDAEIIYRPVDNLSFLSKLIERVVCVQLVNHLDKKGLYEVFQSAYRQFHSTETALLRVQNDILQAVDSRGGSLMLLWHQCCIWHYWSWKTYKNTRYILWHRGISSQMVFIMSQNRVQYDK